MLKREERFYNNSLSDKQQAIIKENATTKSGNIKLNRCSTGNSKIKASDGYRVLIWSMLPISSCPNCSDCKEGCYAVKSIKQYPNVARKWGQNYILARDHVQLLQELLEFQIDNELKLARRQGKKLVFRVHESGDFFSDEYVWMWWRIAESYPSVQFFGYSKSWKAVEGLDYLASLDNVNLIDSHINGKINFGPEEYVNKLVKQEEAFKCPGGAGNNDIKCVEDCTYCVYNDKPVFVEH